ncbi:MAG: hypothetical protein R3B09_05890 [Nannocystaceae bacterium]
MAEPPKLPKPISAKVEDGERCNAATPDPGADPKAREDRTVLRERVTARTAFVKYVLGPLAKSVARDPQMAFVLLLVFGLVALGVIAYLLLVAPDTAGKLAAGLLALAQL